MLPNLVKFVKIVGNLDVYALRVYVISLQEKLDRTGVAHCLRGFRLRWLRLPWLLERLLFFILFWEFRSFLLFHVFKAWIISKVFFLFLLSGWAVVEVLENVALASQLLLRFKGLDCLLLRISRLVLSHRLFRIEKLFLAGLAQLRLGLLKVWVPTHEWLWLTTIFFQSRRCDHILLRIVGSRCFSRHFINFNQLSRK